KSRTPDETVKRHNPGEIENSKVLAKRQNSSIPISLVYSYKKVHEPSIPLKKLRH
ncbi:14301_t:CDS:1, partial [Racocetra persica]